MLCCAVPCRAVLCRAVLDFTVLCHLTGQNRKVEVVGGKQLDRSACDSVQVKVPTYDLHFAVMPSQVANLIF